jgi:starvation-inducible DNA-binding protein
MLGENMAKNNRVVKMSKKEDRQPFETRIDIPAENREQIIAILNARLADTLDLYTQTKFAHWNVKGKDFYQVHLLFDAIAEHVEEGIDLIAERVTALGGVAEGTLRQAAAASNLSEYNLNARGSMEHVAALTEQVAAVANAARAAIDQTDELEDKGTSDLFTEIVRTLDKDLYFLESHLQA